MPPPTTLAPYTPDQLDALITLWRTSFEHGVGIVDPHSLGEQRAYFLTAVLPQNTVTLALQGERLVGFVAATRESIAQLYVHVEHLRQGLGSALLDWAKAQSAGHLWLYTFARNHGACAFYECHGFTVQARGFEPTWQLADVRYRWQAEQAQRPATPRDGWRGGCR